MDLNFLVFPKPHFRCEGDAFYSKLLFVPKQQRQIKNLILKKPSVLNKSIERNSPKMDGKGAANQPYAIGHQSFDFFKFKGATSPLIYKSATKVRDCDLIDEEHEVNIKQEVRTCEKKVRLPKNRNITSTVKLAVTNLKDKPAVQPFSRVADIRKLTVQSSRFTNRTNKLGGEIRVTLSKLMNDLDNLNRSKPTEVKFISQLEKKYNSGSRGTSKETAKQAIVDEHSSDLEIEPPVERPTLIPSGLGIDRNSPKKSLPMRIFPQKSLQQLKNLKKNHERSEGEVQGIHSLQPQRLSSRTLFKAQREKSKTSNLSMHLQTDPLDEVGRCQTPQEVMLKYNDPYGKGVRLGDMFVNRKQASKKKPLVITDSLAACTDVQMAVHVRSDSEAARNKSMVENPLNEIESIPCLLIKPEFPTDVVLLYFHTNGEDIQQCQFFCELLRSSLNCWVVSMEYPGYSVYNSKEISEEIIIKDSQAVMSYLVDKCCVPLNRLIIMGRSLGSGPACWVAKHYEAACLILISPFISIQEVAGDHYGMFGRLLIKDRFNNQENIKEAKCPTLIIHGNSDEVVPSRHSEILSKSCGNKCLLIKPQGMTHNVSNFQGEVREPIYEFLFRIKFSLSPQGSVQIK